MAKEGERTHPCARCGKPTKIGSMYCPSCTIRLKQETKKVADNMQGRINDDKLSTIERLELMAQREFEQEQHDKKLFLMGLKN